MNSHTCPKTPAVKNTEILRKYPQQMSRMIFVHNVEDLDEVVLEQVSDYTDSQGDLLDISESSDPDYQPNGARKNQGKISSYSTPKRPGRQPKVPDHELDADELRRVNRRRERNRQAAARCRERRMTKVETLEREVEKLLAENKSMQDENNTLRDEVTELRAKLSSNSLPMKLENVPLQMPSHQIIALTPLALDQNFNFPVKVEADILK